MKLTGRGFPEPRPGFTEDVTQDDDKKQKRNNLIVALILGAIALTGMLVPLFYYTGLTVPK